MRLKISGWKHRVGSSPTTGTNKRRGSPTAGGKWLRTISVWVRIPPAAPLFIRKVETMTIFEVIDKLFDLFRQILEAIRLFIEEAST